MSRPTPHRKRDRDRTISVCVCVRVSGVCVCEGVSEWECVCVCVCNGKGGIFLPFFLSKAEIQFTKGCALCVCVCVCHTVCVLVRQLSYMTYLYICYDATVWVASSSSFKKLTHGKTFLRSKSIVAY